jgi:excisionase family DNA binding protein
MKVNTERPYLTLQEAADLAGVSKKRLQNLMGEGVLKENVHFARPRGLRVRFMREALVGWLEGKDKNLDGTAPENSGGSRRCKLNAALISTEGNGL